MTETEDRRPEVTEDGRPEIPGTTGKSRETEPTEDWRLGCSRLRSPGPPLILKEYA